MEPQDIRRSVWYDVGGSFGGSDKLRADTIGSEIRTGIDVFLSDPSSAHEGIGCAAGLGSDYVIFTWQDSLIEPYILQFSTLGSANGASAARPAPIRFALAAYLSLLSLHPACLPLSIPTNHHVHSACKRFA